jgi:vitamin B12 transporter
MTTSYLKFGYDLSPKTKVQLALDYAGAAHHEGQFPDFDFAQKDKFEHFHAALALTSAVTKDLDLEVSLHHSTQYGNADTTILSTGDVFTSKDQDKGYGGSAKLAYRAGAQTLVAGIDGDSRTETWSYLADGKQRVSKWAVNANDTIALGDLAVTPGIRYDHTSTNGSIASPSLGVTYALLKDTVLRAYVANGFNTPTPGDTFGNGGAILPNPDLKMEKVTSYQAGAETAALKYVWLKATVFRNDIRDGLVLVSLDATSSQVQNVARERQEGVELEMRTAPVFHTSLGAGAEFITTKDLDSGAHIPDVPVQVYDVSLRYDDKSSFRALLQGRHINWNAEDWELSKYHSLIIDLTAAKKLYQRGDDVVELFAGGHNLLNTPQYNIYIYQNPARWYEIGLRYTF